MTIPNLLSLFRLLLVPVFPLVFFQSWPNARQWAVLIYLVAFLTDIADGWISRHFASRKSQYEPVQKMVYYSNSY